MFGKLFRSREPKKTQRPTFRPMLESLERRDVPSAALVDAAYHSLPGDMSNLEASLAARPTDFNTVQASINAVANDLISLSVGENAFEYRSRLAIDNALVVTGTKLVYDGFNTFPNIPASQFVQIERMGFAAVKQGALDSVVVGFYPQFAGDSVLT